MKKLNRNSKRVMEQIPFENNGRSSTSQKSRGNFLTVENYVLQ
jgi:hypothetical protein